MDLSKLPRMSKTPAPDSAPSEPPPLAAAAPVQASARPAQQDDGQPQSFVGLGAEIWFMSIIGVVLILFGADVLRYEWARLTHKPYHTNVTWTSGDKDGQEVEYPELTDFAGLVGGKFNTDLCLVLLGFTLIVDVIGRAVAMTRMPGRLAILAFTVVVTVLMVGYNLVVAARYFKAGSLPLISLLAIAVGGFFAMVQVALFQSLRRRDGRRGA